MSRQLSAINRSGIMIVCATVVAQAIYDQFEKSHVAHVSQEIISKYPSKKFGNRLSSGLFSEEEDAEYTEYTTTRHTLVKIPSTLNSGSEDDLATIQAQLDKFPGTIQRIVSHDLKDVLTEGDEWLLAQKMVTMEELEERFETRDTANNRYSSGKLRLSVADGVIDDTLPKEYSRRVYQNTAVEDIDHRTGTVYTEQEEDADTEVTAVLSE